MEMVMKAYEITQPKNTEVQTRTWFQAYLKFLASPRELLGLKLLPLVVMGLVPISMATDVLLPVIGLADNIPTAILVIFTVFRTWMRVRTYR
jgi:hypothetical protein